MKAIIIAAGKGTRLEDKGNPMPKVLREAAGRPLLAYVLDSISFLSRSDITIVVGYMKEEIMRAFPEYHYAVQGSAAYGTGYAVKCGFEAAELQDYNGDVIVLQGDVPLVHQSTIRAMYNMHKKAGNALTLLSCETDRKLPFGRIIRTDSGVSAIVEEKNCTPQQLAIKELNVGVYLLDCNKLKSALGRIKPNEVSGEYYFTDVIEILCDDGEKVDAYITPDETEMWGVNTQQDLRAVEDIILKRKEDK